MEGLDEVALTLTREPQIEAYEARIRAEQPWVARGTGLAA
jgi:3-isopropylmalate/(R)-2-methylmalate dehydratase small subunit